MITTPLGDGFIGQISPEIPSAGCMYANYLFLLSFLSSDYDQPQRWYNIMCDE